MESCQKIKFYRKKRNMTQDELAEAANLSTSPEEKILGEKDWRK